MQRKDLAALLDISPSMVTRLAQRGMPTDELERARRWRKRHLHPGRVKGARFDPNRAPVRAAAAEHVDDVASSGELDMADAFECLAVAAHHGGHRHFVAALAHLYPLMSDAQQARVLASGEVHTDLWPLIDEELAKTFPTPPERTTP